MTDHSHDVQARHLAIMSVSSDDWPDVERLLTLAPSKVVPAFGLHPWSMHRYASQSFTGSVSSLLQGPPPPMSDAHQAACLAKPLRQVRIRKQRVICGPAYVPAHTCMCTCLYVSFACALLALHVHA